MRKKLLVPIAFLGLALTACQNASADPHDIHDVDTCIICNMGIHNVQAATQIVMKDGSAEKFDDIGCLFQYLNDYSENSEEFLVSYGMSYATQEWFDLNEGAFVYSEEIPTPMGNGVINFETLEEAERYIESSGVGEVLNYDDLLTHDWNSF